MIPHIICVEHGYLHDKDCFTGYYTWSIDLSPEEKHDILRMMLRKNTKDDRDLHPSILNIFNATGSLPEFFEYRKGNPGVNALPTIDSRFFLGNIILEPGHDQIAAADFDAHETGLRIKALQKQLDDSMRSTVGVIMEDVGHSKELKAAVERRQFLLKVELQKLAQIIDEFILQRMEQSPAK